MPIYEYKCRECGHRFEYLLLSTSPQAECPTCQTKNLEQLISLSSMSSDGTREASLNAAHRKAGQGYKEKQRDEHTQQHKHFED